MSDSTALIERMFENLLAMTLTSAAFNLADQIRELDAKYFRYLSQLQNSWVPLPFLI
ncbi:MAG TPA: hypothetical protein VK030_04245 [Actinomycetales bacterium]|nr:hypothetical protein [Actinomycetales bacterium]